MNKKKIIPGFMLLMIYSSAFAQVPLNETITITTYYSSPRGAFEVLKLFPKSEQPQEPLKGDMYFNNTSESVMYYKNETIGWMHLKKGEGGLFWEASGNNIYNANPGKVIITGVPDTEQQTGNIMWINGNFSLNSSTGSNLCSFVRIGNPQTIDGSTFSFISWGRTDYFIGHAAEPPILRIMQGFYEGDTELFGADRMARDLVVKGTNVGIAADNPLVPLHVETRHDDGLLILRSGMDTADKSGIATFTTFIDRVYLAHGCYLQDWWRPDPYIYQGVPNKFAAKFTILPSASTGAQWYAASDGACFPWNIAHELDLWDERGVWFAPICPASSRSLKENFTQLDPDEILGKICRLKVSRWNYKDEDSSITHIGPVAEDFNRLFKTGSRENELHLIDSIGVSLAGVKALSAKLNTHQEQLEKIRAEIKELKSRIK